MTINTRLPDDATIHLNVRAVNEFETAITQFAEDLLRESGRLEAASKSTDGNPEITSTMVNDANILLRRGYVRQPKKPYLIASQLIATLGGFLVGLLADMDKLKDALTLVAFVILLTITITATVVSLVKD